MHISEAGNLATIVIAVCSVGSIIIWLLRRFLIDEVGKIHEGNAKVLHQVQNSHSTNLRADIDELAKGIRSLRADMQSHLEWHQVKQHRRHGDGL